MRGEIKNYILVLVILTTFLVAGCSSNAADINTDKKTQSETNSQTIDSEKPKLIKGDPETYAQDAIVITEDKLEQTIGEDEPPVNIVIEGDDALIKIGAEVETAVFYGDNNRIVVPLNSQVEITDYGQYNKVYFK